MRILVTGLTGTHCDGDRLDPRMTVVTQTPLLVHALRDLGHEVHRRHLRFGERLTYDLVLCGLAPANGAGSKYLYQAADAVTQAWAGSVPVVWFVDDWRLSEIRSGAKVCTKDPAVKLWREIRGLVRVDHRTWKDAPTKDKDRVEFFTRHLGHADLTEPLLCSVMPWGRPELLPLPVDRLSQAHACPTNVVRYDPSSYIFKTFPNLRLDWSYTSQPRQRRWVNPSLSPTPWVEKVHGTPRENPWPRLDFGRGTGEIGPTKTLLARVPEREVMEALWVSTGALIQPYAQHPDGAGWWRPRFHLYAEVGVVTLGDPVDLPVGPYREAARLGVKVLETWSDNDLTRLARRQADWLRQRTPTEEAFRATLQTVLDKLRP